LDILPKSSAKAPHKERRQDKKDDYNLEINLDNEDDEEKEKIRLQLDNLNRQRVHQKLHHLQKLSKRAIKRGISEARANLMKRRRNTTELLKYVFIGRLLCVIKLKTCTGKVENCGWTSPTRPLKIHSKTNST
jgi:hypothetical protein